MKLLVIAKKFNDIYYALSIPEWKKSSYKTLIIITNKIAYEDFPFKESFDNVIYINSKEGAMGILKTLITLKTQLRQLNYDTVILSNISIVSNKYIVCSNLCKSALLVEDGYMNYHCFIEPKSLSKKLLMFIWGIKQKKVTKKINKTYLLKPDIAEYYFGEKEKLNINTEILKSTFSSLPNFQGKKIFIGQPLYHSYTGNSISIVQYNQLINHAIKKFDIDYYVPHTLADKNENINCEKIDLSKFKCTFEIIASMFNLQFYSVSSTVLYSAKIINPNCKSIMVKIPYVKKISPDNILYKFVDNVETLI